jgi:hypothetical protein
MASSKPILTMLNGIGSILVEDSKSGFVANAGDYKVLTKNILYASSLPKSELQIMGLSAKAYYDQNFSKVELMKIMNSLLHCNDTLVTK